MYMTTAYFKGKDDRKNHMKAFEQPLENYFMAPQR